MSASNGDSGGEIRNQAGHLTDLGESLGEARLLAFTTGHALLSSMVFFLVLAVASAPGRAYDDRVLDDLITDANDVRNAAAKWADDCIVLAEAWRAQRKAAENQPGR